MSRTGQKNPRGPVTAQIVTTAAFTSRTASTSTAGAATAASALRQRGPCLGQVATLLRAQLLLHVHESERAVRQACFLGGPGDRLVRVDGAVDGNDDAARADGPVGMGVRGHVPRIRRIESGDHGRWTGCAMT